MSVFGGVEGGIEGNARNERAVQVPHRLGQGEAIAHLVVYVLKLRAETEPPKGFHASVKRLYGAGGRRYHAIDSRRRFEQVRLEVAESRGHVQNQELVSGSFQRAEDMRSLRHTEELRPIASKAFRWAEQDIEPCSLVVDDVVARVRVRDREIAQIVQHGWLCDPETGGDIGRGQVEIDQHNPEVLSRTGWRVAIATLHCQ